MHRREGGNVREGGEENAWRSEKGGEEDDKVYTYERERNRNGVEMGRGVKRRKYKCIRQKGRV